MAFNPFAGLQLQTPDQIRARQMAERQQAWASGNPYAMQQATFGNFLDSVFGNPEQMQAKRLQDALTQADQSVTPIDGETDIDTQLKRARAMRDAVADLDPSVAAQLNTQMLQLGQIKLEQDKLKAEENRALRKDQREENQELREQAKFPISLAGDINELQSKMAQSVNYMDPRTGSMVSVPANDAIQQAAMRERGWVLAGKPTLQGSKEDVTGLTRPVVTDLQTSLAESQKQLDAFAAISEKFNPQFLTLPTQALQWANSGFEKLTGKSLTPEIAAQAQKYHDWRTQTTQAMNQYIKSITGAQAAVAEYDRLEKSFPNAKMAPSQYVEALRVSVKNVMGIQKRAQQALAAGFRITPEQQEACKIKNATCIWDTMSTPPVSDEEVDAFLGRFGVPARMTSQMVEKNPAQDAARLDLEQRLKRYR